MLKSPSLLHYHDVAMHRLMVPQTVRKSSIAMFHRDLSLGSLAVLSFAALASAVRYTVLDGGTQFIFYNGTLSGSFVPAEASRSICQQRGPYSFGPYYNASMRIGKNPPWDENPIYFELDHFGTDYRNGNTQSVRRSLGRPRISLDGLDHRLQKRQTCLSLGGCTNDAIYNLGFSTTRFECYKDGERCGMFETSPWTYVGEPNVNLSLANIARIGDRPIDPDDGEEKGPFYSVSGDERSWIKENNRGRNAFDFQVPHNSSERNCEMDFKWCVDTSRAWGARNLLTTET